MSLKVYVASDNLIVREGILQILQKEEEFVLDAGPLDSPSCGGAVDVVLCVVQSRPDLEAVLGHIRMRSPGAKILCLTLQDDVTALTAALRAGADGLIETSTYFSGQELAARIYQVADGEFLLASSTAARVAKLVSTSAPSSQPQAAGSRSELTPREQQVLRLLSEGCTNRDIATRLSLSEHTVRSHLRGILQKLQVTNRVQAAIFALENRLSSQTISGSVQTWPY